jgi:hypothetical protein
MVFDYELPRLKNLSLIGVNLPWAQAPFLCGLHNLELALHAETVRPTYKQWECMLVRSPDLKVLSLHYSGPRLPVGGILPAPGAATDPQPQPAPSLATESHADAWPPLETRIHIAHLRDLSLTDLDPSYLVRLCSHLSMPSVERLALALPDQDFTSFVEVLAGTVPPSKNAVGTSPPARKPYFDSLKKLTITALECHTQSWRTLLMGMHALEELDVDFARVGNGSNTAWECEGFFEVLAGISPRAVEVYQPPAPPLPALRTLRISGLSGIKLRMLMMHRRSVRRWCVRWWKGWKGRDRVLDALVEDGICGVRVETWSEPEDEDEEADSETDGEGDGDSGDGGGEGSSP